MFSTQPLFVHELVMTKPRTSAFSHLFFMSLKASPCRRRITFSIPGPKLLLMICLKSSSNIASCRHILNIFSFTFDKHVPIVDILVKGTFQFYIGQAYHFLCFFPLEMIKFNPIYGAHCSHLYIYTVSGRTAMTDVKCLWPNLDNC